MRVDVIRHDLAGPALMHGLVTGTPSVLLRRGDAAYVVVDGSDQPRTGPCPAPYHRFSMRLPGIATPFNLRARVPNGWDYFPACAPLGVGPVLAAGDIIPNAR